MKKYSKIITLLLVLAMVFTLFTGFTYAPVDVDNLAIVTCSVCSGAGKIYGKCNDCPDCMDGSPCPFFPKNCSSCGGTGSITVPDVTPTPTPTVKPSPTPTPTVKPSPTPPVPTLKPPPANKPLETEICSCCLGYGAYTGNCYNCPDCMDGSPCPNYGYQSYCYICGGDGYVKPVVSPTPTPTPTPEKFTVTYYVWDKTFLFFEGWKESFTIQTKQGSIVPDVAEKFGLAFDYMSTDKSGKSKITATTKVTNDMSVYVHLKNIPDTYKIEYKTMEYRMYAGSIIGDYGYYIFKTENIKPGSKINLNVVVPDVKSNDKENDLYKFEYWSFDENGKDKVASDFVPTENTVVFAQYSGLDNEIGFFQKINDNILKPMNSWWGLGNPWDYVVSVVVLLILGTLALGLCWKLIKALFRFLFNLFS